MYGICPKCGKHNADTIVEKALKRLEERFNEADLNLDKKTLRDRREDEWKSTLLAAVSEFEGLGNEIKKYMIKFPLIPKRRNDLRRLGFQNLVNADVCINNWFGFEILNGISPSDKDFLNRMFNKRHLFTHKAGRVDQEYINNTQDASVRINEQVRIKSQEIKRLLPLMKKISSNFARGYDSIEEIE